MKRCFADFHIHIGKSFGKPVKMAAAPSLTLNNVLREAREIKGLDIITIIDGASTRVLEEIKGLVRDGALQAVPNGGYQYENGLVILLGSEVEVRGPYGGAAHFGAWFGSIEEADDYVAWLATVMKNPSLSSQRASVSGDVLQSAVKERGGLFVVHHAFTPHKGMYGNCVRHLDEMLNPALVDAVELGLSADTDMADCLEELAEFTFITNSDAHSLPKIAREYNQLTMPEMSLLGVKQVLHRDGDAGITANYGLHTALGKYHRTSCLACGALWPMGAAQCECGSAKAVTGVFDRLVEIRDVVEPVHPNHRPPYVHQVPLDFIPSLGPKAYRRLLDAFGTEMNVLHDASELQLSDVVGADLARKIIQARTGHVQFKAGGGGVYGKPIFNELRDLS